MCAAIAFATISVIGASSFAQQAPPTQTTPSVLPQASTPLKSTTRMVQLNVIVHDKSGAPVADLTKDDFVITDGKQKETVALFHIEKNDAMQEPPAPPPANTYTNRLNADGSKPNSATVILLDALNINVSNQNFARQHVVKFLEQIQPQDRVAVYVLGRHLRVLHDFTSDASSLLEAMKQFTHGTQDLAASSPNADSGYGAQSFASGLATINFLFGDEAQKEASLYTGNRVRETVAALKAIADHVSALPGRKNLVWVSGSFPIAFGFDNTQQNIYAERESYTAEVADATRALNAANLAVYPVDARGMLAADSHAAGFTSQDSELNQTTRISTDNQPSAASEMAVNSTQVMEALAHGTGGKAFYNSNDISGAIRRAIDDSRVTYALGYYPEGVEWNGKFREVRVEAKRPGMKVQTRRGYFAVPDTPPGPKERQYVIAQAARSPLDATEIGVTAAAQESSAPQSLKITVSVDMEDVVMAQQDGKFTGSVDVVLLSLDDQNKIVSAFDETFPLHIPPDDFKRVLANGLTTTKDLEVPNGAIQVRVVVRDATTGALGTARIPLAAYFPAKAPAH
ncbi:MAG: VWA domain-containing protein [Candidatus Acidiferrales bacterium]